MDSQVAAKPKLAMRKGRMEKEGFRPASSCFSDPSSGARHVNKRTILYIPTPEDAKL